jgi:hypothetical protein
MVPGETATGHPNDAASNESFPQSVSSQPTTMGEDVVV